MSRSKSILVGGSKRESAIRIGKTRPFLVKEQAYVIPKKSVFNKIVGDSAFELEMAGFLDGCGDIVSFVKNSQSTNFRIEYRNADGGIANYYPDFIVKRSDTEIWIIETKGREDLDDPLKWERLRQWCADATAHDGGKRSFHALFVRQEDWEAQKLTSFGQLITACERLAMAPNKTAVECLLSSDARSTPKAVSRTGSLSPLEPR